MHTAGFRLNGACTPGAADNCDDGNPGTIDGCVGLEGCAHTAMEDGISCEDGNACTLLSACESGICAEVSGRSAMMTIRARTIGVTHRVVCIIPIRLEDELECTENLCKEGECISGPALDCDDQNPCTLDLCVEGFGCSIQPLPRKRAKMDWHARLDTCIRAVSVNCSATVLSAQEQVECPTSRRSRGGDGCGVPDGDPHGAAHSGTGERTVA